MALKYDTYPSSKGVKLTYSTCVLRYEMKTNRMYLFTLQSDNSKNNKKIKVTNYEGIIEMIFLTSLNHQVFFTNGLPCAILGVLLSSQCGHRIFFL